MRRGHQRVTARQWTRLESHPSRPRCSDLLPQLRYGEPWALVFGPLGAQLLFCFFFVNDYFLSSPTVRGTDCGGMKPFSFSNVAGTNRDIWIMPVKSVGPCDGRYASHPRGTPLDLTELWAPSQNKSMWPNASL